MLQLSFKKRFELFSECFLFYHVCHVQLQQSAIRLNKTSRKKLSGLDYHWTAFSKVSCPLLRSLNSSYLRVINLSLDQVESRFDGRELPPVDKLGTHPPSRNSEGRTYQRE